MKAADARELKNIAIDKSLITVFAKIELSATGGYSSIKVDRLTFRQTSRLMYLGYEVQTLDKIYTGIYWE